MKRQIKLSNGRIIGKEYPTYIIAEIGINHNGSLEIAKKLIDKAAIIEVDAIKFQKRDIKNLYQKKFLKRKYKNNNSFGRTYGEHKKYLEFTEDQLIELRDYSVERGLDFLVSGFDEKSFEFINNVLNVTMHKIPSPYVNYHQLLRKVAEYQKPIILSTGMHSFNEIKEAVKIITAINKNLILMQCTSLYPIENYQANLRVIETYQKTFNTIVGYSSHDKGVILPVAAVVLGARVIEKHFTLDRTMKGPDHAASVEPRGLELIKNYIRAVEESLGDGEKRILEEEVPMREKYGLSAVVTKNLIKGTRLDKEHITFKIPGSGIQPNLIEKFIGKKLKNNKKTDELLFEEDFIN